MKLKKGVKLQGIRPELVMIIPVLVEVYSQLGKELVITSVLDGVHSEGSLHYSGGSLDARTRYFKDSGAKAARMIRSRLTKDFDVVLEKTHLHIEYQP